MNRNELVAKIAECANATKKEAEMFLDAFIETVTKTLSEKKEVRLIGFGTFSTTVRKERVGRNPKTKEEIKIPEMVVPKFKPGENLRKAVAKK
jgi:DNA-binding protein HU-beta